MYSWLIKTKAALALLAGNFALKLLTENEESFLALITKKNVVDDQLTTKKYH